MKKKWIICSCCEGEGTKENPAFSNGFTSSEWAEMSCDEQKGYMAGDYDVECDSCAGTGKVQVPNVAVMSFAEKRELVLMRRERAWQASVDAEIDADIAAERRLGC